MEIKKRIIGEAETAKRKHLKLLQTLKKAFEGALHVHTLLAVARLLPHYQYT